MLRKHWVEIVWGVFAAGNVAIILALQRWETIPFHLVWVSLTLVYGMRKWGLRATALTLGAVMAATGAALALVIERGHERPDELAEVPLMAAMFVAMVWHAWRRQAAVEEARRLAEKEHKVLEREREFVRDASHELRTPITVARGHAELIQASHAGDQVGSDAAVILDELNRLSRMSERLLLLVAAEHPDFLHLSEVDLGALVQNASRRWIPAARRRWTTHSDCRVVVRADEERLKIALDALIENAINSTEEGDAISISSRGSNGRVEIEIADNGVGVPAEQLGRVFERFTRTDQGRGRRAGGTGLGLAIVKAVVEAHDGRVALESEVGRGSVFRIELASMRHQAERVRESSDPGPTS
jgi:two-component system, OmpR family, sensor kinase